MGAAALVIPYMVLGRPFSYGVLILTHVALCINKKYQTMICPFAVACLDSAPMLCSAGTRLHVNAWSAAVSASVWTWVPCERRRSPNTVKRERRTMEASNSAAFTGAPQRMPQNHFRGQVGIRGGNDATRTNDFPVPGWIDQPWLIHHGLFNPWLIAKTTRRHHMVNL